MFPFLIFFLSIQPVWLVPEITGFLFLSENVDPEWCTQVVEIVLYDFKERNVGLMILVFQYTCSQCLVNGVLPSYIWLVSLCVYYLITIINSYINIKQMII